MTIYGSRANEPSASQPSTGNVYVAPQQLEHYTEEILHQGQGVEVGTAEREYLSPGVSMQERYGLTCAGLLARVRLAPDGSDERRAAYLIDRGPGAQAALYEGGEPLAAHERYVVADYGFLAAARRAKDANDGQGDPAILQRYVQQNGGLRAVDLHADGATETRLGPTVSLSSANWVRTLGTPDERRARSLVPDAEVVLRFGVARGEGVVLITKHDARPGTEVTMGNVRHLADADRPRPLPAVGRIAMRQRSI